MLRDYQLEMLDRLEKAWRRYQSVMVQMPTGTGKTILLAQVIKNVVKDNITTHNQKVMNYAPAVLVVAHRMELIEQIGQTLKSFGIDHGMIVSGKNADMSKSVQVASIQTLTRNHALSTLQFSLIVVDEAHHAVAKTYRKLWEQWTKAKFLGLTATPCRMSGTGFNDLFQTILCSYNIQEFIDKGWLSDFEYVSASPKSNTLTLVKQIKKRGADGDYQQKELATVLDVPESIEHLYNTYRHFANGKKGIVYAINRQHAAHIAECYREHGVCCAVIDSKTPAQERKRMVDEYKTSTNRNQGGIDVLVNVDIFSEGFDCPEVEFIQLARPTLSLSKYMQQVGRGMRISEGKPHVIILDNVGMYQLFGLPTIDRDWRGMFLGMKPGKGEQEKMRCVVVDSEKDEKELVNLEMVRIKRSGQRGAGLEIFIENGKYGVMRNGKVTCHPRFKNIVRMDAKTGFFAAGIFSGKLNDNYVEYASLIDRKGCDCNLRLFRDVVWKDGVFYSSYKPKENNKVGWSYYLYWDPKGNCYYEESPSFKKCAGVEIGYAYENFKRDEICYKLRYNTGNVSPRFMLSDIFYNDKIIVARDYLIIKKDNNHAYSIRAYLPDSILVQQESGNGYQQFFIDGRKGNLFTSIPSDAKRFLFQVDIKGLKRL